MRRQARGAGTGGPTWSVAAGLVAAVLPLGGCNPIVNVAGAFFPAWMVCMVLSGFTALLLRWLLRLVGAEEWIGPKPVMYLLLLVACTCTWWLVLYADR